MDIFLDMTGTITDMESENLAILKLAEAIGKRFKIDMAPEEILRRIEEYRKPYMDKRHEEYTPIRFLILEAVKQFSPPLCANDSYWVIDEYSRIHAKYVRPAPGVVEALKELRAMARHMGIITDGDRPYSEALLGAMGISKIFDSITTAEDAGVGKPNIKIFELALEKSKSEPKIYIGDSELRDMQGAKNAGMLAIKIGSDTEYGDFVVRSLKEAVPIIRGILRQGKW